MSTILLVGDMRGSYSAMTAAVPATHTVQLVATGQLALLAAAEDPRPVLLLLDTLAPVDMPAEILLSTLAAAPETANIPVARMSFFLDTGAPPRVFWLTSPPPDVAELADSILRVHNARMASAHEARLALKRRIEELTAQANRALMHHQAALQAAEWLNATPRVTAVITRVLGRTEVTQETLRELRGQLIAESGKTLDAADVARVLEKLAEVME